MAQVASSTDRSSGPLSADDHRQYADACDRSRSFQRWERVAAFNGWVSAILAVTAAPFAMGDPIDAVMTLVLVLVAVNEFRGRRLIRRLDPRAGRVLSWNQVGFLAMIVVYCLLAIHRGLSGESEISRQLRDYPELATVLGSTQELERIHRQLVFAIYGLTALFALLFQGGTAFYYFRSGRRLTRHVRTTPDWILRLQRTWMS
ncbi:MAG: hypothetical protein FJ297_11520 [Planctomycetes bacterium]|nr:hypothetical protein [Planctomycetota bacterium]